MKRREFVWQAAAAAAAVGGGGACRGPVSTRPAAAAGPFAYSCLTVLADGTIGLPYERDGYEKITFARFNLAWLTNGGDGS
jgi:hypothetical protein